MIDTLQQTQHLSSGDILNIVFGIITLIGTTIGVIALWANRREKRTYSHLFKLAESQLQTVATEETLKQKKGELSEVSQKIVALENQIRKQIPIEAKRAVLHDRLDEALQSLKKYYDEVITTKTKIDQLGQSSTIPDEILKAVQIEIQPRYIIRERIANLKTYITVLTSAAAAAFALLPHPTDRFVGGALFVVALPILLNLIRLSFTKGQSNRKRVDLIFKLVISMLGAVILFLSSAFGFFLGIEVHERTADKVSTIAFALLALGSAVYLLSFFRKTKRKLKQ
jgi:hypothetical protein